MLFGNVSFLQRFGPPRSQIEYDNAWTKCSEAEQAAKWNCITGIMQVAILLCWPDRCFCCFLLLDSVRQKHTVFLCRVARCNRHAWMHMSSSGHCSGRLMLACCNPQQPYIVRYSSDRFSAVRSAMWCSVMPAAQCIGLCSTATLFMVDIYAFESSIVVDVG